MTNRSQAKTVDFYHTTNRLQVITVDFYRTTNRVCMSLRLAPGISCLKGLGLVRLSSLGEERAGSTPAGGTTHL